MDAFCWKEKNDNNYILYQHDQEIPTDWANNHVGNSDYLNNICQPESDTPSDGGHGRGMSQYGAYYMITEQGATYEYILSFYFPDSTISGGGSCGGENSNGFINSEGYTLPINMDVVSMIPGEYNGYCNNHIPTPPANPRADVHHAMDFTSPEGTPVYAAHDGVVTKLYFNPKKNCMSCPGNSSYGIGVQITNTDGTVANYAHFSECLASLNQEVKAGDIIGKVGETGSATGPHLHFDIAENGVRKDPRNYLPLEGVAVCYGH